MSFTPSSSDRSSALKVLLRALAAASAALLLLVLSFVFVYRPWQLNWGASDDEVHRVMPGDEIVLNPTFNATRAVTIDGGPEDVWPWLVQMGYLRAGFYSHDRLDNDNIPSAERLLPEYQNLAIGDSIPLSRSVDAEVRYLEPDRFLLLVVLDPRDQSDRWTWTWGIYKTDLNRTRLVTRLRVRASFRSTLMLDLFEIVMMRKCLLGIKRRVEAHATRGTPSG